MSLKHGTALVGLIVGAAACPTPIPVLPQGSATDGASEGSTGVVASSSGGPSSSSTAASTGPADGTTSTTSASTASGTTSTGGASRGSDGSSSSTGMEVGCGLEQGGCDVPDGEWWDAQWSYRQPFHIASPVVGPLDDVVVPIRLDEQFEFACAQPNADDIRFVDATGTELAHEVDEWRPEDAAAVVWVRLPLLDAAGVDLWMYYGNEAATATTAEVWSAELGYEAVMHFGGDLDDARGIHHGEPAVPGDNFYQEGMLGQAIYFEDILFDRRVELMDSDAIDDAMIASEALTLSAWIRADPFIISPAPLKTVITRGPGHWAVSVFDSDEDGSFNFRPPAVPVFFTRCALPWLECDNALAPHGNHYIGSAGPVIEDEVVAVWHHVAVVFETVGPGVDEKRMYLDGVPDGDFSGVAPLPVDDLDLHDFPITIGALVDEDRETFHGRIDEVHVISQPWTAEQVRAEYEFSRDSAGSTWVQAASPQCR